MRAPGSGFVRKRLIGASNKFTSEEIADLLPRALLPRASGEFNQKVLDFRIIYIMLNGIYLEDRLHAPPAGRYAFCQVCGGRPQARNASACRRPDFQAASRLRCCGLPQDRRGIVRPLDGQRCVARRGFMPAQPVQHMPRLPAQYPQRTATRRCATRMVDQPIKAVGHRQHGSAWFEWHVMAATSKAPFGRRHRIAG
jgi:hypothetical protein